MLSIQQTRIFLLQKYFENKPLYNMTFLVDLDGPIDTKILEKSINFLCLIEPVLNTNIKLIDGYPQVFFNKNKIKIEETIINYQIKENELKNYIFDLGNDKLFKLVYCKKDSKNPFSNHQQIMLAWPGCLCLQHLHHTHSMHTARPH